MNYEERKRAGICVKCGKEPAVPGLTRCEICRQIDADWNAGKRDLKKLKSEGNQVFVESEKEEDDYSPSVVSQIKPSVLEVIKEGACRFAQIRKHFADIDSGHVVVALEQLQEEGEIFRFENGLITEYLPTDLTAEAAEALREKRAERKLKADDLERFASENLTQEQAAARLCIPFDIFRKIFKRRAVLREAWAQGLARAKQRKTTAISPQKTAHIPVNAEKKTLAAGDEIPAREKEFDMKQNTAVATADIDEIFKKKVVESVESGFHLAWKIAARAHIRADKLENLLGELVIDEALVTRRIGEQIVYLMPEQAKELGDKPLHLGGDGRVKIASESENSDKAADKPQENGNHPPDTVQPETVALKPVDPIEIFKTGILKAVEDGFHTKSSISANSQIKLHNCSPLLEKLVEEGKLFIRKDGNYVIYLTPRQNEQFADKEIKHLGNGRISVLNKKADPQIETSASAAASTDAGGKAEKDESEFQIVEETAADSSNLLPAETKAEENKPAENTRYANAEITLEELAGCLGMSLMEAAVRLGVSYTALDNRVRNDEEFKLLWFGEENDSEKTKKDSPAPKSVSIKKSRQNKAVSTVKKSKKEKKPDPPGGADPAKSRKNKTLVTVEALEEFAFDGLTHEEAAERFGIKKASLQNSYLCNNRRPEYKAAWKRGAARRLAAGKENSENILSPAGEPAKPKKTSSARRGVKSPETKREKRGGVIHETSVLIVGRAAVGNHPVKPYRHGEKPPLLPHYSESDLLTVEVGAQALTEMQETIIEQKKLLKKLFVEKLYQEVHGEKTPHCAEVMAELERRALS